MKALSLIIVVSGCFASEKYVQPTTTNTAILKTELAALNLDVPQKDLDRNLSYKDYRCIAVCGIICYHPGVSPDAIDYCRRFGSRTLLGTSDMIEPGEHGKLIATASKYASDYNLLLIPQLKQLEKSQAHR
ncbi:MAG TPA: hypothetical protein VGH16_22035 [Candidatus Binatia bacterium]